jgi:hypothetical protein
MPADPQWFANDVAVLVAVISGLALGVAGMAAWYARRQAHAGERQANAGEVAVRLQAEALKSSAEDTARALEIAKENSDAAKASAAALKAQAADTHSALDIAKVSADAAVRLAEANEALAISAQRAWIVVDCMQTGRYTGDGCGFKFVVQIRNCGRTPAFGLRVRYCVNCLEEEPYDYVECQNIHFVNLAAESTIPMPLEPNYDAEECKAIKDGVRRVYLYGNVSYDDIYGYGRSTKWKYVVTDTGLEPVSMGNKSE